MELNDIIGMLKRGISFVATIIFFLIYCVIVVIYKIGYKLYEKIF